MHARAVLVVGLVSAMGLTTLAANSTPAGGARQAAALPGAPNCPMFPANNVWNADVSALPTATTSQAMINAIGATTGLHPDFDTSPADGIPYNVVPGTQPKVPVIFDQYSWSAGQSDPGPYPIPPNPNIEGGSDQHIIVVDSDNCKLYEMWDSQLINGTWHAGSGATWSLTSNALRPDGLTSADAAGLPILPGLVRYDEVSLGMINHALRFTAQHTNNSHIYPARHDAGSASYLPPMGLRVRLKASVDISSFAPQAQVILTALKKYGMILADNGSNWYISGSYSASWDDSGLHNLNQISGSDFEVVDTSNLVNGPDPGSATATPVPATSTRTAVPATATATPMPPTATPSATRTASSTATPIPPTPTWTSTPVPRSTHVNTPTLTPIRPTSTSTRTPVRAMSTATRTPIRPTTTPTRTPIRPTSTPIRIRRGATRTPTSAARIATTTPTATATDTPVRP